METSIHQNVWESGSAGLQPNVQDELWGGRCIRSACNSGNFVEPKPCSLYLSLFGSPGCVWYDGNIICTVIPTRLSNILSTCLRLGRSQSEAIHSSKLLVKSVPLRSLKCLSVSPITAMQRFIPVTLHVFVWTRSQIPRLTRDLSPFKCESPNPMTVGATIRGGLL